MIASLTFVDLPHSIAHIEGAGRLVPSLRTPTYTFSVRKTVPFGMSTRAVTVQLVGLISFAWRYFRMSAVFVETAKPPVILVVVKRKKCPRWKGVVDMPRGGGRFGRVGRLPFRGYSPLLRQEVHWSPSFLARIFVNPQDLHGPMLLLGMLLYKLAIA